MNSLSYIFCLVLGFATTASFAAGGNLVCEEDGRAADGPYTKLQVKFFSHNRANVYLSQISGGFAPPGAGGNNFVNQLIGQHLVCNYGSGALDLKCYNSGNVLALSISTVSFSGTQFVEVVQNSRSIALFQPSSCKKIILK